VRGVVKVSFKDTGNEGTSWLSLGPGRIEEGYQMEICWYYRKRVLRLQKGVRRCVVNTLGLLTQISPLTGQDAVVLFIPGEGSDDTSSRRGCQCHAGRKDTNPPP